MERPEWFDRFVARIAIREPGECWHWTGGAGRDGYGRIAIDRRPRGAHRVSLELATGKPLGDLHALHSCDRPGCVNPAHLRAGTHKDNMAERSEKGRGSRQQGEKHGMSKLTAEKVREIRRLRGEVTQKEVARRFGVTVPMISRIQLGRNWSHIAGSDPERLFGERHPGSRITAQQVAEIRALRGIVSQRELARRYGCSQSLITKVQRREVWAGLDPLEGDG